MQRTLESADNEPRGRLLLALATDPAHRYLAQTRRSVALMGIVTFAIGLTGIVAIAWMQRRGLHREAQMQLTVIRAKRLAALGQMAGQVAHEIRNPLNAISLSLQNLRRQLQDGIDAGPAAEWEGYLDTTQSELLRLNRIVEDYLSVSRFPPIHRQDVDLSAWLAEIVALYAEPAQEAGIAVQLTVPPQPLRFPLDPDQMRQALGNLMLNAIQASPPDTPIKVTLRPERRGVVMEVEDRGAGIAAEDLERVFELYYTTRPDGSGLGLPIALRIIEDHGGILQIKSRPRPGNHCVGLLTAKWLIGTGRPDRSAIVFTKKLLGNIIHMPTNVYASLIKTKAVSPSLPRLQILRKGWLRIARPTRSQSRLWRTIW